MKNQQENLLFMEVFAAYADDPNLAPAADSVIIQFRDESGDVHFYRGEQEVYSAIIEDPTQGLVQYIQCAAMRHPHDPRYGIEILPNEPPHFRIRRIT